MGTKNEIDIIKITCDGSDYIDYRNLTPFQGDLKTITNDNLVKLKKSIIKYGFTVPAFVWKSGETNFILDAHQRVKALGSLFSEGYEIPDIPVVYIQAKDEKEAKEKLLHITSQYGEFTQDGFADFVLDAGLDIAGLDIRLTNDEFKISEPLSEEETDGDDDVNEDVESITKLGDLWELGEHRLLCGDSTDAETILGLMNGQLGDMYLSDPPYNVNYEGKTKKKLTIQNDKMSDSGFKEFLVEAFTTVDANLKHGGVFYIWHADSEGYNFRGACFDIGWQVRQCLIWNKNSLVMGRQDYHWKHEPCLYGWKSGAGHLWAADRKQTTILEFNRPSRSSEHPTMKPVELMEYQVLNNTKGQDIVIDTFLGSGSTLIACEKTKRRCYGAELDEHYCDVIVNRYIEWCDKNGRESTVKLNGESFDISKITTKVTT